ncbi:rta1 domain protein [Niveomyces insectorum RCEF 264]|uniref:Rta1 domain protein n=1 Tax=Niveomyces insectorum RCEF 264 TaxID=1081102 RepID=A0A167ULA1_9HYPO|nr:rta1 domain protein [Niveomyces insectorum RCEF 264]
MANRLPGNLITYGPDVNCTLALCPVEASILGYQPSLGASGAFIGLFAVALVLHLLEGLRWRASLTGFAIPMVLGCLDEIIGYVGRIIMHGNPFSFSGFLMQIICITTAPVFFCAAIYVTLARTILFLDRSLARFNPRLLYWVFIPCDVLSLVFQAAGGALSSVSTGSNDTGVNMSLFGLSFQVFTLVVFCLLAADFLVRFHRKQRRERRQYQQQQQQQQNGDSFSKQTTYGRRVRVFLFFLAAAILFILIRCVYRIDELSEGYTGTLFREEGIFYGLESVMITVAVFCLCLGQPGFGLQPGPESVTASGTELSSVQDNKYVSSSA